MIFMKNCITDVDIRNNIETDVIFVCGCPHPQPIFFFNLKFF